MACHLLFYCLLLCLACSGGGASRIAYDRSQEAYRSASYDPKAITRVAVLPPAFVETENIEGIGPPRDWMVLTQEEIVLAFGKVKIPAEKATADPPENYRVVVEGYLAQKLADQEITLAQQAPDAAKTYFATKEKISEIHPREWARKWEDFARTFSSNPFASLARSRIEALALLPPHYPSGVIAVTAQSGVTHIVIPAELKWVRSQTFIGGVKRQVFAAQVELEIVDAKTGIVVWRGHGIHKMDEQNEDPLGNSMKKAVLHAVKAAL